MLKNRTCDLKTSLDLMLDREHPYDAQTSDTNQPDASDDF